MKTLWSGWKTASMITDSLPLILTGLNSGAGGAVRPDEVPAAVWAGLAASAGFAAAAGAAVAAGGAAAAAVGLAASAGFGASVGLAAAAGAVVAAGAAACWLPHAARIGRAAIASPMRTITRRERRRPITCPATMSSSRSPTRILLDSTPTIHGRRAQVLSQRSATPR